MPVSSVSGFLTNRYLNASKCELTRVDAGSLKRRSPSLIATITGVFLRDSLQQINAESSDLALTPDAFIYAVSVYHRINIKS